MNGRHIPSVVVGNKRDIVGERRKVRSTEGKALADMWGTLYVETSAK